MSRPIKIACHYCGQKTLAITRDHIVPLSLGGRDKPWNIVPSCFPCNSSKAAEWPTCDCPRCSFAISRQLQLEPGLIIEILDAVPVGAMVIFQNATGSRLIGKKVRGYDDEISFPGLGSKSAAKMLSQSWRFTGATR